jgi:hypothetical protein
LIKAKIKPSLFPFNVVFLRIKYSGHKKCSSLNWEKPLRNNEMHCSYVKIFLKNNENIEISATNSNRYLSHQVMVKI